MDTRTCICNLHRSCFKLLLKKWSSHRPGVVFYSFFQRHRQKDNSQDRKGSGVYITEWAGEGVFLLLINDLEKWENFPACGYHHALSGSQMPCPGQVAQVTQLCKQGKTWQKNFHVNKCNRRHCREGSGKHGQGGGRDNPNHVTMTLKLGLAVTAYEKGHWNHHWLFSEISDSDSDSQKS